MQWREVEGYEGYYEVSNTGKIRSVDRVVPDKKLGARYLKGKTMKLSESKDKKRGGQGYMVVNLRKNHTSKVIQVHRLVAKAFIENPDNLPTINHKDGNKHNNSVDNLEWVTYAENNIHALRSGLRHPRGCEIAMISMDGAMIGAFKSVSEAARQTGIGRGVISHCINGRIRTAGGCVWRRIGKCNDYPVYGSTAEDELLLEVQERI